MVFGADWTREAFEEDERLRELGILPRIVPVTYTSDDIRSAHKFLKAQLSYNAAAAVEVFADNMDAATKPKP